MGLGGRGTGATGSHRVAWTISHGPIPDGLWVLHRCDNPPCCNPAHLFLGTVSDNNKDMCAKGRHGSKTNPEAMPRGTRHGLAKLTDDAVRQIRSLWERGGIRQRDIATQFGVNQAVVWAVIHRKAWAHVT